MSSREPSARGATRESPASACIEVEPIEVIATMRWKKVRVASPSPAVKRNEPIEPSVLAGPAVYVQSTYGPRVRTDAHVRSRSSMGAPLLQLL